MEVQLRSLYASLKIPPSLPIEEWLTLGRTAALTFLAKGEYWVRSGETSDSIGICIDGLFRIFYETPGGDEHNKSFCSRHDFIAPYGALLQRIPSYLSIQSLQESQILVFRYEQLAASYDRHPGWERFGRIVAEQLFVKKETRERELLLLTAEERYRLFLSQYGHLESEIPQYHIASYLGITPVALSRIRRRINLG
ncbi:Crp/Fnr family transcriptional regulator [Paenibacillus sp. NPDC057967]|uniref:Crp/Fnr family transcriptional regulator n=1 Tax=Paenibacillus sp. NPDC057967 TaxID=3346293 RepID=UPI0036DFA0AC